MANYNIRFAKEDDTGLLLELIRELADYEKRLDQVNITENDIYEAIFRRNIAEAVIAEYKQKAAGFAVFFHNFSTFSGKTGIYIEDLYVRPGVRGIGIGKSLLSFIAKLAVKRNCDRIEWTVLHWNKPSISFYERLGAAPKNEWLLYKMTGKSLKKLADGK